MRFIVFLSVLISACNFDQNVKPSSSGKSGEVLIVVDEESWLKSSHTFLNIFTEEVSGLPQPEPRFTTSQIKPASFTNILRLHRNIIIVNDSVPSENILKKNDVWAKPQLVVFLSEDNFNNLSEKNFETIAETFEKEDEIRFIRGLKNLRDAVAEQEVKKVFQIELVIPEPFFVAKSDSDFIWLRQETDEASLGLIIYKNKTGIDSKEALLNQRNLHVSKIPGPTSGTFMSTDVFYPVSVKNFTLNEIPAIEAKGLWKIESDFMGGPFLSYTFKHTQTEEIITVEGFVYAPKFDKRNYMRQLRAILNSLQIG